MKWTKENPPPKILDPNLTLDVHWDEEREMWVRSDVRLYGEGSDITKDPHTTGSWGRAQHESGYFGFKLAR